MSDRYHMKNKNFCIACLCIYNDKQVCWGVFVFPSPRPFAWPPALSPQFVSTGPGPQFVFTGPGPKFVFTGPGPQFVFTGPGSKFLFTGLGQSEAWACRYQPCPPNLYLLALAYDFYYCALNLHLSCYL